MARNLAHHLGRALQLTNILRDLDEDADMGRLYLPRELLERPGSRSAPRPRSRPPALPQVCATMLARARNHFDAAESLMAREPRPHNPCAPADGRGLPHDLKQMEEQGLCGARTKVRFRKAA